MKKLIIALAVAAVSSIGNAASVNWNSAAITLPDGSNAAKGSVVGYLFVIDKTVYDSFVSQLGSGSGKDLSDLVYAKYGNKTGSAYTSKTSPKAGTANMTDDSVDYAGKTAYAVILYTTTQDDIDYYMGNIGSAVVEGAMDVTVDNMGKVVFGGANTTTTAWSTAAVPEPTSGLLMLLGMAGLALKRKRA